LNKTWIICKNLQKKQNIKQIKDKAKKKTTNMLIKKRNKLIKKLNYCKQFKSIYYLLSRRNFNNDSDNYNIFFQKLNQ